MEQVFVRNSNEFVIDLLDINNDISVSNKLNTKDSLLAIL